MGIWEIPEVNGLSLDKAHMYQGIGVRNLEQAVYQGWVPVKEDDKVGTNWPVGPNKYRMFQEQVLCKMPRKRWEELRQEIDATKEALSVETAEKDFREDMEGAAYGSIKDG